MRWAIAALASVFVARGAAAEPRSLSLVHDGDACGTERVAERVRALVGRDPFDPAAPLRVELSTRGGERIAASVEAFEHARSLGRRELEAATCAELADAVAVIVAMLLDRPELPPAGDDDGAAETPAVAAPTVSARPADQGYAFGIVAGAAATMEGSAAGSLALRLRGRRWSTELGFERPWPETHATVEVSRGAGTLAVAAHAGRVAVGPVLAVGWITGRGRGLPMTRTASTPLAAVGARLAAEQALSRHVAVRARLDGRVLLTSTAFTVDGATSWATPRFEAWLGIDIIARIP